MTSKTATKTAALKTRPAKAKTSARAGKGALPQAELPQPDAGKPYRILRKDSGRRQIRTDFVPKDGYLSKEFLLLEKENLWPKVWQVACRVEELKNVGDYVTYDVADDTIVVIRTAPDTIKSFHNVCQHRGRRLLDGIGHASKFHCRFHGWQWNIDGQLLRVLDRQDWEGCPDFSDHDLRLKETLVDTWGGWVFINMDLDAEPLAQFLAPVPAYLDAFEFDRMRMRWHKTIIMPCNWKVCVEAFNEGYHVFATHPQLQDVADDLSRTYTFGKHGMFNQAVGRPFGAPSPRTGRPMPDDIREGIVNFYELLNRTLWALVTERSTQATHRLLSEVPAEAPILEVFARLNQFQKEAADATGAGWPEMSFEHQFICGSDWHIFPNLPFLMTRDGNLTYRMRPNGDDPDSCIFDIWSLVRYAPGAEPPIKHEFYEDWREGDTFEQFGGILPQDFLNMGEVQKGMKSRGFAGSRTNPLQESTVSNFHRALYEYLYDQD